MVSIPDDLREAEGRWIIIDGRSNVILVDGAFPMGLECPVSGGVPHLLGVDDGTPIWAVGVDRVQAADTIDALDGEPVHLRPLFGTVLDSDWALAGRAAQVLTWARDHRFCGRCGTATESHTSDRALQCPACGMQSFPRISPAVIMLVERTTDRGPEVLLAWGRQFPGRFFSALAGFVEPGESLEQCVVREVREETGIEVGDVRYFGSQPWPFPHSIMIGFTATYLSGEVTIQEEEIVEAGWFGPNELPPVPRGGMSIAGWLIDAWLTDQVT
jgi:NAD+ diphosphatase